MTPLDPTAPQTTPTTTIVKTARDAGEDEGELESMAKDLGRAEGTLYLCKLLRKHKVGTNVIEMEAARMWSETCQRAVGAVGGEVSIFGQFVKLGQSIKYQISI